MKDEGRFSLLGELVPALEFHAPGSLVIIDSLNRLIRTCGLDWNDFITFLEDIQNKSKKWGGLVYLLLERGLLASTKEEEIMDIADGVLVFEWIEEGFSRRQAVYIKKFRGLLPCLTKDNIARFDSAVTTIDGFAVTNVKHISGRR